MTTATQEGEARRQALKDAEADRVFIGEVRSLLKSAETKARGALLERAYRGEGSVKTAIQKASDPADPSNDPNTNLPVGCCGQKGDAGCCVDAAGQAKKPPVTMAGLRRSFPKMSAGALGGQLFLRMLKSTGAVKVSTSKPNMLIPVVGAAPGERTGMRTRGGRRISGEQHARLRQREIDRDARQREQHGDRVRDYLGAFPFTTPMIASPDD